MLNQLIDAVDYFRDLILNELENCYCWIGGGATRDFFLYGGVLKELSDVDIFFPNQQNYDVAKSYFISHGYTLVYENENATRWQKENNPNECVFELIKIFYRDPKHCIKAFDFTVCCCAIDRSGIYYHETFFMDLAGKNLIINDFRNPEGTFSRIKKYMDKGFNIHKNQITILFNAIRNPESNQPINLTLAYEYQAQEDRHDNRSMQQENTREVPHTRAAATRAAALIPRSILFPNSPHISRLNLPAEQVIRRIPSNPPRPPIQETQIEFISEQPPPNRRESINGVDDDFMRDALNVEGGFINNEVLGQSINANTIEEEAERRRSGSDIAQAFLSESRRARRDTRGRRETTTNENL